LPTYTPELNLIEAAWHATKHPLANGRPDNIPELGSAPVACLRKSRDSQRGCVMQSDLPPFFIEHCIIYETVSSGRFNAAQGFS
jgi:hypothetical protein